MTRGKRVLVVCICLVVIAVLVYRLLSQKAALAGEDAGELPADVVALRTAFTAADDKRDEGLVTPADIERANDIVYATEDSQQVMDIYWPRGSKGELPTIVSFHGGGYVYGDKDRYQYYCMDLAERGFTVVNPSYRLAPTNHYPDQLIDMASAIQYALEHANEYHIDPNNIFFVGDSAGAQMAAQFAQAVVDPTYAAEIGLTIPSLSLRAVGLNCGMYKLTSQDTTTVNYLGEQLDLVDQLDLTRKVDENYPPAFITSAYGDFLLSNAEPFWSVLNKRGAEAELHIYGDEAGKTPGHVFHLDIRSNIARACNDEQCAFFLEHVV